MTTDTSEHGLEDIIFNSMVGAGWIPSNSSEYNAEYCVDLPQLSTFLKEHPACIQPYPLCDGQRQPD